MLGEKIKTQKPKNANFNTCPLIKTKTNLWLASLCRRFDRVRSRKKKGQCTRSLEQWELLLWGFWGRIDGAVLKVGVSWFPNCEGKRPWSFFFCSDFLFGGRKEAMWVWASSSPSSSPWQSFRECYTIRPKFPMISSPSTTSLIFDFLASCRCKWFSTVFILLFLPFYC